jgi:glycosyltransferase involved in cell wall biosynthesis
MHEMTADWKTGPLVSAVIPAYNSETTVARALESALAQTYQTIEIVVVDDCSTDRTAEIVKSFADRGVRLVRLSLQQGASGARNAGIEAATGDLVAFLDSDDEWLPVKIEKQVALIMGNGTLVFVSCSSKLISTEGEDLGDLYYGRRPVLGADCWKSLLARNTIATPSVLVWRSALLELGGFDRRFKICEDQDMWIRLALRGSVGYVDEHLVRVHSRPGSLSSKSAGHSAHVVLDVVDRHIAEQRARLSRVQIRAIRGERLEWLGRTECNDNYFRGLPTIFKSMLLGYRPLQTLFFLASASPPGRWLKAWLRARAPGAVTHAGPARPALERKTVGSQPVVTARIRHPMLPHANDAFVHYPREIRPRLVVIIDAEEQYDWRLPLSRANVNVRNMAAQVQAQEIYKRFGLVPTYALDYPVVVQEAGYRPIMELLQDGECEIGAQLHAWVTPPHNEEVCERNSFANNLSDDLERRKLEVLVEAIQRRFEVKPRLYRAGRYGAGSNTAAILEQLGFDVDCSVVPGSTGDSPYAPDYSGGTARPYWLPTRRPLLEIPVTIGITGPVRHLGEDFHQKITSGAPNMLRVPGIMARTGLFNRVRLSPEGNTLKESKRLTRRLVADGYRIFAISYHSSSLEPGNTPYVQNKKDLKQLLKWIDQYLEFFFTEINGIADTPRGVHAWSVAQSPPITRRSIAGSENRPSAALESTPDIR